MTEDKRLFQFGTLKRILKSKFTSNQEISKEAVIRLDNLLSGIVLEISENLNNPEEFPYSRIQKNHFDKAASSWLNIRKLILERHKIKKYLEKSRAEIDDFVYDLEED